jgi:hypothetical protein
MTEDFVEVNVQPLGSDNAFGIDLRVQDSTLNPEPFDIAIRFQLEEGEIPGLNEDATNDPEQLIELAKGLLLCDSDEIPPLGSIPPEECPPAHTGVYYNLDIEMELSSEEGEEEVKEQQWQIAILQSSTQIPIEGEQLFQMIQDFFTSHL